MISRPDFRSGDFFVLYEVTHINFAVLRYLDIRKTTIGKQLRVSVAHFSIITLANEILPEFSVGQENRKIPKEKR